MEPHLNQQQHAVMVYAKHMIVLFPVSPQKINIPFPASFTSVQQLPISNFVQLQFANVRI